MGRKTESTASPGVSISVSILPLDSDLFKHKPTSDVLLFLTSHRFSDFSLSMVTGTRMISMIEAVQAIPAYTEDIRDLIISGILVYKTSDFETVEKLLLEEGATDE